MPSGGMSPSAERGSLSAHGNGPVLTDHWPQTCYRLPHADPKLPAIHRARRPHAPDSRFREPFPDSGEQPEA